MSGLPNRIPLEEILELLAGYGRPTLNQFAGSATPGHFAAGTWNCELALRAASYEEAGKPDWYFLPSIGAPKGWSGGGCGCRCIGRGASPAQAAERCLDEVMATMEGPAGPYYRPISTEAVQLAERARR